VVREGSIPGVGVLRPPSEPLSTHGPHEGFRQLLEIGRLKKKGYFVFTSNVDGQFQIAGFEEDRIEECHGSIHHLQCSRPCSQDIWDARGVDPDVDETQFRARDPLPRCPKCGSLARPNVLMFNDWDWIPHRTRIQSDRFSRWLEGLSPNGASLAVVELGAGKAVATVRMTSEGVVRGAKATLIRINPRDYDVPAGHIGIPFGPTRGSAGSSSPCRAESSLPPSFRPRHHFYT